MQLESLLEKSQIDVNSNYQCLYFGEPVLWNLLHCASFFGQDKILCLLVDKYKGNIEKKDGTHKGTCLGWSAFGNQFETASTLITKYKAKVMSQNKHKQSPWNLLENKSTKWKDLFQ